MLSREFTTREKILIVALAFLLIGILYYQFVYKTTKANIKKYDTSTLSSTLKIEQSKAQKMKTMKAEMASNKQKDNGVVASYNNIKNEVKALNDIFAGATTYNVEFEDPTKDGEAVRRNIDITFTTTSYSSAKKIINKLYKCKYRCLISDISIGSVSSTGTNASSSTGSVSGTIKATFFETLYNAVTEDGLTDANKSNTSSTTNGSSTSSTTTN